MMEHIVVIKQNCGRVQYACRAEDILSIELFTDEDGEYLGYSFIRITFKINQAPIKIKYYDNELKEMYEYFNDLVNQWRSIDLKDLNI